MEWWKGMHRRALHRKLFLFEGISILHLFALLNIFQSSEFVASSLHTIVDAPAASWCAQAGVVGSLSEPRSWQDSLLNLSLWPLLSFATHDTDILITYAYQRHEKAVRMYQKRKASAAVTSDHFQNELSFTVTCPASLEHHVIARTNFKK